MRIHLDKEEVLLELEKGEIMFKPKQFHVVESDDTTLILQNEITDTWIEFQYFPQATNWANEKDEVRITSSMFAQVTEFSTGEAIEVIATLQNFYQENF